jgi:Cupin-like domain
MAENLWNSWSAAGAAASANSPRAIDDEWRKWIAHNVMNLNSPDSIVTVLVQNGFALDASKREVAAAQAHPYVQAGMAQMNKLRKRDWVIDNYRRLNEQLPDFDKVDRRHKLSRDEFHRDYYTTNRPVVIEGAMEDWPALTKWNPQYLKQHYGDLVVETQHNRNTDARYEINQAQLRTQMRLGDYVDKITSVEATNDLYITANNSSRNGEVLKDLWKDIVMLPEYLKTDPTSKGFFWFGPKGTVTPLHHDLTNNFMAQVHGRKLVRIVPACYLPYVYNSFNCYSDIDLDNIDYARHPLFRQAKVLDVEIGPGDVLFLPIGCWHYVRGLEISITMSFTNFVFNNDFVSHYSTYHEIGL